MYTLKQVEAAGGFSVIYADPPWQYNDKGSNGAAEDHYLTMSLEEICALPVSRLAAKDAALFLWGTWTLTREALQVMSAWGFEFKSLAFDWVKLTSTGKPVFGLGRWTRNGSEPCWLATRGKPERVDASVRQVLYDETWSPETLEAVRGKHSAKPPEVRERIERLMGAETPSIELFARERAQGWECWGNEVVSTVKLLGT
jgi:N6-adenosine-specific RNA methylase IME4